MKKLSTVFWLCILAFALHSCSEDEHEPQKFSIQLLTDDNDMVPEATAYILSGETVIASYPLHGAANDIPFDRDPSETYTLLVTKDGYESFSREFEFNNLLKELRGAPLRAPLGPAVGLTVTSQADGELYGIDLQGSGEITVTWPDGSQETHSLPLSVSSVIHSGSDHIIKIKGDLKGITFFRAFGYGVAISNISGLNHLKSLTSFLPGWVTLSDRLDLRHNRNLEQIDLFEAKLPGWFSLPQQHRLADVTISLNDRSITAAEIDLLINNIYRNTIREKIYNGMLSLTGSDTPSQDASEKIRILEDEYGWSIDLDL